MKKKTVTLLTLVLLMMLILLPTVVPSGAVTTQAHERYMDSMPMDDEYAFLFEN